MYVLVLVLRRTIDHLHDGNDDVDNNNNLNIITLIMI